MRTRTRATARPIVVIVAIHAAREPRIDRRVRHPRRRRRRRRLARHRRRPPAIAPAIVAHHRPRVVFINRYPLVSRRELCARRIRQTSVPERVAEARPHADEDSRATRIIAREFTHAPRSRRARARRTRRIKKPLFACERGARVRSVARGARTTMMVRWWIRRAPRDDRWNDRSAPTPTRATRARRTIVHAVHACVFVRATRARGHGIASRLGASE